MQSAQFSHILTKCVVLVVVVLVVGLALYMTETPPPSLRIYETPPVPENDVLEKMSSLKLTDFFHGYIHSVQVLCNRRVRMGGVGDGGWDLCEDPRFKPDPKKCLVYSFGIGHNPSFDIAMQKYGCEVHAYDPSLGSYDPSKGEKFTFHTVGVGHENLKNKEGWMLHTLGKIRDMNGHELSKRRLDMVKMDVEGAELLSLEKAVAEGSLDDVRQLAFEIHISKTRDSPDRNYLLMMLRLLRGLWLKGFRMYFTKRNAIRSLLYDSAIENKQRTSCYELHMLRIK